MTVDHVPRGVVYGGGQVHVELVHRDLGLAQQLVGLVESAVQAVIEVDANLNGIQA